MKPSLGRSGATTNFVVSRAATDAAPADLVPADPARYFIRTFGCQMNEHDTESIAGVLEADGMTEAAALDDADVVVLNTCCIRENADNKLYAQLGNLKTLKAQRPNLRIAVAGCLAQKDRDTIQQRAPHVDVVFGTHNLRRAAELLEHARVVGPITEILEESDEFPTALPVRRDQQHAAWVTIQIGCDNACAFCIVPAVRGREISRPFGELVAEVAGLAAEGVTEITLLGQNVNSYGRDITLALRPGSANSALASSAAASSGPASSAQASPAQANSVWQAGQLWASTTARARPLFADLLRALGEVEGINRIRYISPHPKDLRPETVSAMAEVSAICEHLHLPLQSGSDKVLSAMHRGYTAQRYLEKAQMARATVPNLALTTDIIVGFPGETEDDFTQTLELVAEVKFDSAFTFVFSARPGTEAAQMTDQFVAPAICKDRMERLRTVIQRSALASNEKRVGRIEEVLVEGRSKTDPAKLSGRTRQNRLIHFATDEPLRQGTYAHVKAIAASTFYLSGELVEVLQLPTHRTRIPVVAA